MSGPTGQAIGFLFFSRMEADFLVFLFCTLCTAVTKTAGWAFTHHETETCYLNIGPSLDRNRGSMLWLQQAILTDQTVKAGADRDLEAWGWAARRLLGRAVAGRQWPEVSDFVARFCTFKLRESENTRPCEKRVRFSHGRVFLTRATCKNVWHKSYTSGHCLPAAAQATTPGNVEWPLRRTRPQQETRRPRPASLELTLAAVPSRPRPWYCSRRGKARRGRRQGRKVAASPRAPGAVAATGASTVRPPPPEAVPVSTPKKASA